MSTCKRGHVDPPRNAGGDCKLCKKERDRLRASKRPAGYWRDYYGKNRERIQENARRYGNAHETRLRHRIWKKQGIDAAEAENALVAHAGRCAICTTTSPGGKGRWPIDHDHATGRVRGVLCRSCNIGIGLFRDDSELVRRAALYLEFHKCLT